MPVTCRRRRRRRRRRSTTWYKPTFADHAAFHQLPPRCNEKVYPDILPGHEHSVDIWRADAGRQRILPESRAGNSALRPGGTDSTTSVQWAVCVRRREQPHLAGI